MAEFPAVSYDAWLDSKRAPTPIVQADKSGKDVALDVLLAREEFAKAAERVSTGVEERNPSGVLGGIALGAVTLGSYFLPAGQAGRFVAGAGARAASGAARRLTTGELVRNAAGRLDPELVAPARDLLDAEDAIRLVELGDFPAPSSGVALDPLPDRRGGEFVLRRDVSPEDFVAAMDVVRKMPSSRPGQNFRTVEETVHRYTPEEYAEMRLFLSEDGLTGMALKRDGDMVSLFSAPGLGRADAMLNVGIANGGRKLDAFDESDFLPSLYRSKGFREVGRMGWDPAYKPPVWRGEDPDVVFMELDAAELPKIEGDLPAGRISSESRARLLQGRPSEGESIMSAIFTPISAPRQFGATSKEAAERIFEAMKKRGPIRVVTGDDLRTPEMMRLLQTLQQQIRTGQSVSLEDFLPFNQRIGFADELGLVTPQLIQNKPGMTFRPMLRALREGDFTPVLEDLAAQINNVFTLLDDDVFNIAFYPFMHEATMKGAKASNRHPAFLSALSGVLSAGAAPIKEAQSVKAVVNWAKNLKVRRGVLDAPAWADLPQEFRSAAKAYSQLINNPDWLSNQVSGLASKTYVYSMLKMNPRMVRALVIDRVDASARLAAREVNVKNVKGGWAWSTENAQATEGIELALGGFAERVVASSLDIPPSAVQENVWAIWRVLRDLEAGNGPSRQSSTRSAAGESMDELLRVGGALPKAHRELFEQNMGRLEDEVRAGGAASRYWEFDTPPSYGREILVPRTDMPVEGYLPPAIRTPRNIEALEGAIGNAEVIGQGLRDRLPWAPIALQLSLLGGVGGAVLGAGQRPAEASDGSVTMAAAPVGGAAAGAAVGAVAAGSVGALAAAARNMVKSLTLKPVKIAGQTVQPLDMMPGPASTPEMPLGAANRRVDNSPAILNNYRQTGARQSDLVGAWQEAFLSKDPASARTALVSTQSEVNELLRLKGYGGAWNRKTSIDPDELGQELTDAMIYDGYEVGNYLEAMMYWNRVGNVNITSELRTGDLPYGDADFDSALRTMEQRYRGKSLALQHLEKLNRDTMDILLSEGTVTTHPEFIAYRGIGADSAAKWLGPDGWLAARVAPELLIGAEIADPAFLAMSVSSRSAELFTNSYLNKGPLFQLRVPSDEPIIPISANIDKFNASHTGENEILLHPNRRLRIVHIATPDEIMRNYRMLDGSRLTDNAENLSLVGGGTNRGQWQGPWSLQWSRQDKQFIAVDDATGSSLMRDFNVEQLIPPPIITLEVI